MLGGQDRPPTPSAQYQPREGHQRERRRLGNKTVVKVEPYLRADVLEFVAKLELRWERCAERHGPRCPDQPLHQPADSVPGHAIL